MSTLNVDCPSSIDFEKTDTLLLCTPPHQPLLLTQNSSPLVVTNDYEFYAQRIGHCEVCSHPCKVMCCSTCTLVFHVHCALPLLKKNLPDNWRYAYCLAKCNKSNQQIRSKAKIASQEMKQMMIDMDVHHEEDEEEEEEEVEDDVEEEKVKFHEFLKKI